MITVMPHDPYKRTVRVLPTVIPTGIIEMHCLSCGKVYRRGLNGLPLSADGSFKPCTNGSMSIRKIEEHGAAAKCESLNYRVFEEVELAAMPIGRVNTDLRRQT